MGVRSAAVALAYLPGLVGAHLGGHAVAFSALVTLLTAGAGILVQPLARRVDDPVRPRLLSTALAIVVIGPLVGAVAAQPLLVIGAALVLGAGYGCRQLCGLLEGPAHGAARSPGRADRRVPGDLLPGLCRAVPARLGCPGRAGSRSAGGRGRVRRRYPRLDDRPGALVQPGRRPVRLDRRDCG